MYKSSRMLALTTTKMLFPDRLEIKKDKVIITKRRWLGLMKDEETIRIDRIASIRMKGGLLSGKVIIETTGGAKTDLIMSRMWKKKARKLANELEGMI